MLNIVYDGNFVCNRNLYALLAQHNNLFDRKDAKTLFFRGIFESFDYDLRYCNGGINTICYTFDSRQNWRKELYINEFAYKEGRKNKKKKYEIDWPTFNQWIDDYRQYLIDKNLYVFYGQWIEADDWQYYLSKKFYEADQSVVIFSGDDDIKQLVKRAPGKFITVYDHFQRKYMVARDEDPAEELDEVEAFFNITPDNHHLTQVQNNMDTRQEIINPIKVLFIKVISGDISDDIPSCHYKMTKGGPIAFGKGNAEKMFNEKYSDIGFDFFQKLWEDETARRTLASEVLYRANGKDLSLIGKISDAIKRNVHLMYLDDLVFPDRLKGIINTNIKAKFEDKELRNNFRQNVVNGKFDPSYLYKGTDFDFTTKDHDEY